MKTLLFITVALTVFSSCVSDPIKTEVTQSNNIKLELLFEKNGCKMYRFKDERYVYWSDCSGRTEYINRQGRAEYKQVTITDRRK